MEFTRRTLLIFGGISAAALVVPLALFPSMFGLELARISWVSVALELTWFSFIIYLFNRQASLLQLVKWAAIGLGYRWVLGAFFGLVIAGAYGMNIQISLDLGLYAYMPGVLFQAAVIPFALTSVLKRLKRQQAKSRRAYVEADSEPDTQQEKPVVKRDTIVAQEKVEGSAKPRPRAKTSPQAEERQPVWQDVSAPSHDAHKEHVTPAAEANGFDKAARYLGEDGAVHFAAVIDREGLLLGQFQRRDWIAEDWAPFALSMLEVNRTLGDRTGWGTPERVDLQFADSRVSVVGDGRAVLVIFAERHQGDVLNIRINQAYEMIRKYMAERYGQLAAVNAENKYV